MKVLLGLRIGHPVRQAGILLVVLALIAVIAGCAELEELDPPCEDLEIRDWHDLDAVRNNPRGHHRLMNDLDSTTAGYAELAGPTADGGRGWEPIRGRRPPYSQRLFSGTFDGQGYEIRDLHVNRWPDPGLFALVRNGGVIKDVHVRNATVTDGLPGGGLAADHPGCFRGAGLSASLDERLWGGGILVAENEGTVINCSAHGSVSVGSYVGGLVGINWGTVTDSSFTGSVTGWRQVGGLVGRNWGGRANVISCHTTANVTGELSVGGLVGLNRGTVDGSHSMGDVDGRWGVGGLVGTNEGQWDGLAGLDEGAVIDSFSAGSVAGIVGVGGLVGENGGTVGDSYSAAIVAGEDEAGGLVGSNYYGPPGWAPCAGNITRCYAIGKVSGQSSVGGLVGDNPGSVSDSFWDVEASGMEESDGGTGKTTVKMMDIATYTETEGLDEAWDMVAVADTDQRNPAHVWNIVDGQTYPFLSWQSAA